MPRKLSVPYYPQKAEGFCLAACAQMVLHYWGIERRQDDLAQRLGVEPTIGVPASRIKRLTFPNLVVVYDIGDWATLSACLDDDVPVIAMIQAGELAYWHGEYFQHAVVVVGYDESNVWLMDPDRQPGPVVVSIDEFMLAWGEVDYRYAVFKR